MLSFEERLDAVYAKVFPPPPSQLSRGIIIVFLLLVFGVVLAWLLSMPFVEGVRWDWSLIFVISGMSCSCLYLLVELLNTVGVLSRPKWIPRLLA
jgi:hypothetical protein